MLWAMIKKTSFSVVSNTINQPTWALHYVASSLSVLSPQIIAPKTNNNHGLLRNSHQESKTQVDPFQPFQKSPPSSPFCSYLKKKKIRTGETTQVMKFDRLPQKKTGKMWCSSEINQVGRLVGWCWMRKSEEIGCWRILFFLVVGFLS